MKRYSDCMEVRDDFSALLDGELVPEEQEAIEEHLAECAECLRELDAMKQVNVAYSDLPIVRAPDDFEERVATALKPRIFKFPGAKFGGPRMWSYASAALAASLLLVVGVVVSMNQGSGDRFQVASTEPEESLSFAERGAFLDETRQSKEDVASGLLEPSSQPARREIVGGSAGGAAGAPSSATTWDDFIKRPATPELKQEAAAEAAGLSVDRRRFDADAAQLALEPRKKGFDEGTLNGRAGAEKPAEAERAPAEALKSLGYLETEDAQEEALGDKSRVAGLRSRDAEGSNNVAQAPEVEAPSALGRAQRLSDAIGEPEFRAPADAAASPATNFERLAQNSEVIKKETLRSWNVRDAVWYEHGYDGQSTIPLKRGSEALIRLGAKYPDDVGKIVGRPARQIFQIDGQWYDLEASEEEVL